MNSRIYHGLLWILILASGAAHDWQWKMVRQMDTAASKRFTNEQYRSNEFRSLSFREIEIAKRERAELRALVETNKSPASNDSPLLTALGEDFREKSESYIMHIAERDAGTPNEAFGKERAMWHAERLEACGLSFPGMTAKQLVDEHFKAALKGKQQ